VHRGHSDVHTVHPACISGVRTYSSFIRPYIAAIRMYTPFIRRAYRASVPSFTTSGRTFPTSDVAFGRPPAFPLHHTTFLTVPRPWSSLLRPG
jgi:hypothetical protein